MKESDSGSGSTPGELNLWGTSSAPISPTELKIFRISELTRRVRDLLEGEIGSIWVEGEVSNHRRQASGHHYFTLKDESSQLTCVLFRGNAAASVELRDGLHVEAFGDVTVYEARGQYQMIVRKISTRGAGALQAKFEALKARLHAEGLFDADRKKMLPVYPKRIGIITSPTGAALRDFLRVLQTRVSAELIIAPVRVQGTGASKEIVEAIERFSIPTSDLLRVDAIALIRGGGSLEDLWEFNEEIVARAIARSDIPIITGIGHEIDFTIADFAADVRSATPSAAAATLLPEKAVIQRQLLQQFARMRQTVGGMHRIYQSRLQTLARSGVFREPARRIEELSQRLDDSIGVIHRSVQRSIRTNRMQLAEKLRALYGKRPNAAIALHRHQLAAFLHRLGSRSRNILSENRGEIQKLQGMLRAFSPQATLERGFTMTTDEAGKPLADIEEAKKAKSLITIFRDGKVPSQVTSSDAPPPAEHPYPHDRKDSPE